MPVLWLLDKGLVIVHVFREANRVADGLANLAFAFSLGFQSFDVAPLDIAMLLNEDVDGPLRPRQTRM